ncbi:hypothetical protein ACA910_022106 [Epithemia clementina (nom. ined.)]
MTDQPSPSALLVHGTTQQANEFAVEGNEKSLPGVVEDQIVTASPGKRARKDQSQGAESTEGHGEHASNGRVGFRRLSCETFQLLDDFKLFQDAKNVANLVLKIGMDILCEFENLRSCGNSNNAIMDFENSQRDGTSLVTSPPPDPAQRQGGEQEEEIEKEKGEGEELTTNAFRRVSSETANVIEDARQFAHHIYTGAIHGFECRSSADSAILDDCENNNGQQRIESRDDENTTTTTLANSLLFNRRQDYGFTARNILSCNNMTLCASSTVNAPYMETSNNQNEGNNNTNKSDNTQKVTLTNEKSLKGPLSEAIAETGNMAHIDVDDDESKPSHQEKVRTDGPTVFLMTYQNDSVETLVDGDDTNPKQDEPTDLDLPMGLDCEDCSQVVVIEDCDHSKSSAQELQNEKKKQKHPGKEDPSGKEANEIEAEKHEVDDENSEKEEEEEELAEVREEHELVKIDSFFSCKSASSSPGQSESLRRTLSQSSADGARRRRDPPIVYAQVSVGVTGALTSSSGQRLASSSSLKRSLGGIGKSHEEKKEDFEAVWFNDADDEGTHAVDEIDDSVEPIFKTSVQSQAEEEASKAMSDMKKGKLPLKKAVDYSSLKTCASSGSCRSLVEILRKSTDSLEKVNQIPDEKQQQNDDPDDASQSSTKSTQQGSCSSGDADSGEYYDALSAAPSNMVTTPFETISGDQLDHLMSMLSTSNLDE